MKRKLNPEEVKITNKVLLGKIKEIEWTKYQMDYLDLMINTGLRMNYEKKLEDFKIQRKEFEGEIKMINDVVNTLKSQLRNGVEVKKEVKEEKKDEVKEELKEETK